METRIITGARLVFALDMLQACMEPIEPRVLARIRHLYRPTRLVYFERAELERMRLTLGPAREGIVSAVFEVDTVARLLARKADRASVEAFFSDIAGG